MQELKNLPNTVGQIIQNHYPIPNRKPRKRWVIAQSRHTNKQQETINSCTEIDYHRVIDAVKRLWLNPGEVIFERDYKYDKEAHFMDMHSFLTPTFYIRLSCSFNYDFEVEYAFFNCPYEAQVRTVLKSFPLDGRATEKELQSDFTTFYENVLKFQPSTFIHPFKR
jgi:hypothetical protein